MALKPQFLKGVVLDRETRSRLDPVMANWQTVHKHIRYLPKESNDTLDELFYMLLHELDRTQGARLQVLYRLFGMMTVVRRTIDEQELLKYAAPTSAPRSLRVGR